MILRALLVSKDDLSAETLIQVLAQFGVAVDRSSATDVAVTRLAEEQFDQVIDCEVRLANCSEGVNGSKADRLFRIDEEIFKTP